jgi:glutamate/aspartate transport system ATP-binding protein
MISLAGVSKWYDDFQVLRECTVQVEKGEVVVICGPSGSGKSTLIKCINGLEPIQAGRIVVDGTDVFNRRTDLPRLRSRVGMVFQHFELFPHLTVMQNLLLAPCRVRKMAGQEARQKSLALLDRVGLADQAEKYPAQLSGGQQRRVAIARALVMDPIAMLFDEPTSALIGDDQGSSRCDDSTSSRRYDDAGGHSRNELCPQSYRPNSVHGPRPDRG